MAKIEAGPATIEALGSLIVKQTAGKDNEATDFLMTSDRKAVTTSANSTVNAGTIKLTRVAARLDLYNKVPNLKITKITITNPYQESRLFATQSREGLAKNDQPQVYDQSVKGM